MYKLNNGNVNAGSLQKEVIKKWKAEQSFKESIKNREGKNEFIFYDGPPFANGLPHYGHLLTSYIKDTVARFQTMAGKKTERRFGWDCHGLPAEMETEKELKVSGRTEITKYGIDKFNEACRAGVMKYSKQWQEYIEQAGRWVDFEDDYRTMDPSYMESVIWGFKELYKKGLVYEDYRVMPYSWKCETPLSNFETRMDNSYRSHTSKTLTVKIELKEKMKGKKAFVCIWTTTPWTLPSNIAVAVNKNLDYVGIEKDGEILIIAKKLASKIGDNIILEFKGADLIGLKYQPLFRYFETFENAFRVIHGDFVEDEGGTGIVHIASGFGEDDYSAAKQEGIKVLCPVDDAGKFTSALYNYLNLETGKLSFAHIEGRHQALLSEVVKDHSEMEFAETTEFYKKHLQEFAFAPMVITLKDTGEEVGIGGLIIHDPSIKSLEGNIEIICFLKSSFQGKGIGTETFKLFAKYAFARFEVNSVVCVIAGKNDSSFTTLSNIGFTSMGEITDPRAKQKVTKLVLNKYPEAFKKGDLEFRKNGKVPENFHYNKKPQDYLIYEKGQFIGCAGIKEKELDFAFMGDQNETALQEILERFAFDDVICRKPLKNSWFYEDKGIWKMPSEVLHLKGRQVFETNDDIAIFLKYSGNLIKREQYIHNYPHCWRTDTPLIYKAVSSWYVEVSKFKDRMVELNKEINWIPEHVKEGQFGKWLENARDWSITRNRFWGTPVPIWKVVNKKTGEEAEAILDTNIKLKTFLEAKLEAREEKKQDVEFYNIKIKLSDDTIRFFPKLSDLQNAISSNEIDENLTTDIWHKRNYVFGSMQELQEFFGKEVKDLHRPFIDELVITDPYNSDYEIRRVTDVLDCWFESGSMPFASIHYPFALKDKNDNVIRTADENKEWFEKHNPADFIVEYVAQTRGWFYTLVVLSTAIFDKIPFKTCLCHGVILDENGQKLSKRLRNYPDPLEVFETLGSDAMRFFLLSSSVVLGGDLNISKDGAEIREVVRLVIKPIWNAYNFFAMYANADEIKAEHSTSSKDTMDIYILSKLTFFTNDLNVEFSNYNFPEACKKISDFIDVLNNWYIRRSKERFWKETKDEDKLNAYNTLYTVLTEFAKAIAPILPFTSESLNMNLGL